MLFRSETVPASEAVVHSLSLSTSVIRPSESGGGSPAQVQIQVDSGIPVLYWDGDNNAGQLVQNGQYYVSVHTVDGNGGTSTMVQGIVVLSSQSTGRLVLATPNVLEGPDPLFTFTVQEGLTNVRMEVRLYDLAGELMAHFEAETFGNQVRWQTAKIASGTYLAVVDLSTPSGDRLGRTTLPIEVIK